MIFLIPHKYKRAAQSFLITVSDNIDNVQKKTELNIKEKITVLFRIGMFLAWFIMMVIATL